MTDETELYQRTNAVEAGARWLKHYEDFTAQEVPFMELRDMVHSLSREISNGFWVIKALVNEARYQQSTVEELNNKVELKEQSLKLVRETNQRQEKEITELQREVARLRAKLAEKVNS